MRRHYLVKGRVQGVGFRQFTAARARALGLNGWVRNLPDGSVEAEAQGSASSIAEFELHLHRGPQLARVDAVESADLPDAAALAGFEIRH
jgi:acylphosphatase